jgi:D-serine deaminase-like pyridoxal phosphate-dependent protein
VSANSNAVGLPLSQLETPALCLDLDVYRRNMRRMTDFLIGRHRLQWRPHMKGQKAVELAQEAIRAGAIGVTCATVYEAEAMALSGVSGVLVANQVAGERKLARLARLQRTSPVIAATDSAEHAEAMDRAARAEGVIIPVLIEVNVGMHRCGIGPGEPAVLLARRIMDLAGLRLAGVMGWEGHVLAYHDAEKQAQVDTAIGELVRTANAIREAGIPVEIVSASGSGTFRQSAGVAGLTEVQAGGGVFSDLSYQKWGLDHEFALTVLTRVISRPSPTRIIVDGGFKTMSTQHGMPRPLGVGELKSIVLSAEHGNLELLHPDDTLRPGATITFIPGYTDSTVCLHDEMCVIRNGILEAVWTIPGRTGRR